MFRSQGRPGFDVSRYADALADFGQRSLLGPLASRAKDTGGWQRATMPLRAELNDGDRAAAVEALCELARERGGWIAVGAWRFIYWDYDDQSLEYGRRALDAALHAIVDELGLLNAYWFLERAEIERYRELYGKPPPGRNLPSTEPDFGGPVPGQTH